jgi:outer membrane protein assembly factor BamB
MDWIIYAYKVEDRIIGQRPSLFGPDPEGNYGLSNPPPSPWTNDYYMYSETLMNEEFGKLRILIQEGRLGEQEMLYAAYLREIAGSSFFPRRPVPNPAAQVWFRAEAARLLGYFGSRETIPFLAELYTKDPDPAVRAAAAESIGRIGVDPEGIALSAFSRAVNAVRRDEQVLIATASAIGSLCRFSGPPLSDSGIRLLVSLDRVTMPTIVRNQAKQEIASLGNN